MNLKDFSEIPLEYCPGCGHKREKNPEGKDQNYCGFCPAKWENYKLFHKYDPIEMAELKDDAEYGRMFKKLLFESDSDLKGEMIFELFRTANYEPKGFGELFSREFGVATNDEKAGILLKKMAKDMHKERIKEKVTKQKNGKNGRMRIIALNKK